MMPMLRNIANQVVTRWRLALVVFLVMSALMSLGILMRHSYIATVKVDIGGVLIDPNGVGVQTLRTFEDVNMIEAFFSHHVFTKKPDGRFAACIAQVMCATEGQKLRIECKGRSDPEVRELIASALEPFIVRHSHYFEVARRVEEQRQKHGERRLRSLEQRIKVLQEQPISSLAKAQIIAYQLEIETLDEQMATDRLLGDRVKATRVDADGVEVLSRTPNWMNWLAVLVLAIGSSIFMAVFMARLDGPRNE